MEQVIFGGGWVASLHSTNTVYNSLTSATTWYATEFYRRHIVSTNGKIKNLRFKLDGSPGAGKSYDLTLMVNGAPSALTVHIHDADTSGSDTEHEVDVVAGDTISLRSVPTGSPTARTAYWTSMFESATAGESLIMGGTDGNSLNKTSIEYAQIMGATTSPSTTENNHRVICPTSGKIKNLYVELSADPGTAPDAYSFTLRRNKISQALTVTITADDTTGSDTEHEITVTAGQILTLRIRPLNGPSVAPFANWGMTFVADTDGESIILGGSSNDLDATATEYNRLQADEAYMWLVELACYQLGQVCTLKKLYILLSAPPSAGDSYDFTVRIAGADSNVTVHIHDADTTGNSGVLEDTVANDDYVNLKVVPTSTPDVADAYWGLVCYIEPPPVVLPTVTTQDATGIGFD